MEICGDKKKGMKEDRMKEGKWEASTEKKREKNGSKHKKEKRMRGRSEKKWDEDAVKLIPNN